MSAPEYTGPSSRAALVAIIGEDLVADAERRAMEAPPPSARVIAAVAQAFGPGLRALAEREAAGRHALAA